MPNSADSLGSQQLKETRFLSLLNKPVVNIWKNSNMLVTRHFTHLANFKHQGHPKQINSTPQFITSNCHHMTRTRGANAP